MCIIGSIPATWGSPGAWPALTDLILHVTNLTGTLPAPWGGETALPSLTSLEIGSGVALKNLLSGTLPDEWGKSRAFPKLLSLRVVNCTIRGVYDCTARNMCLAFCIRRSFVMHSC